MNPSVHDHITRTVAHVKNLQTGEASGHDWWHTYRVWHNARFIGEKEGANLFIVELAALLHDIADWKFYGGDTTVGPAKARAFLEAEGVEKDDIDHVCAIIYNMSFKGTGVDSTMATLEGKVVQDADRLDAIGAIGIARVFAYGGFKGREIYNPDVKPVEHQTIAQYLAASSPSINHFYEKLLLLRDLMNTATGRALAEERHAFMELYLKTFFDELQVGECKRDR
jgi:uncharacterized protein